MRLEKTPNKGYGLFANRRLKKGQELFAESPLIIYDKTAFNPMSDLIDSDLFTDLYLVDLDDNQLDEFFSLSDAFTNDSSPTVDGIIYSNSFQVSFRFFIKLKN